ncbi:male-specific lethal 1-like 1 isoform X2 [Ischnura elegans]|uniref:male-specific lethal 1-like 1 isoform X2 n=1 Tax=Ischnura elegans TaxID=197161 RepID=UPI001ED8879F|nr:male-specific lethal 1-like 1 isoform X2 [Ischnura elegans]
MTAATGYFKLKQRLERMDRRVNLQKHREVSEIGPLNCGSPAPGSPASPFGHNILPLSCSDGEVDEEMDVGNGTRSLTPSAVMVDAKPSINLLTNVLQFPQVTLPNNTNSNTNITPLSSMSVKRKRLENGPCPEPDSSVNNRRRRRRLASWSSDTPSSGTRRSGATQLVDGAAVADSQDSVEPISRRNRVSSAQNVQRSTKTPPNKVNQWESRSARTRSAVLVKRDAVLVTSEHYYTPVGDEDFHWCAANDELAKTQAPSVEVEVPSWRIRVCTSCYSMEGTENLGDEVFNKRHMRLEIDERRRKRWDIQRIREQRQYERLKQREGVKSTGRSHRHSRSHRSSKAGSGVAGEELDRVEDSSDIESFWPDPEDAKFLEVSDDVPVSAFGVPLVKFEPSTFSTSWGSPRCKPEAPVTNNSRRKYDGRR